MMIDVLLGCHQCRVQRGVGTVQLFGDHAVTRVSMVSGLARISEWCSEWWKQQWRSPQPARPSVPRRPRRGVLRGCTHSAGGAPPREGIASGDDGVHHGSRGCLDGSNEGRGLRQPSCGTRSESLECGQGIRPRSRLVGMALRMPLSSQDEGMDFTFTDDIVASGAVGHTARRVQELALRPMTGLCVLRKVAVSAAWTTESWRKSSFATLAKRGGQTCGQKGG